MTNRAMSSANDARGDIQGKDRGSYRVAIS